MAMIRPKDRPIRWVGYGAIAGEKVLESGVTEPGDVTGIADVLETIAADDDDMFVKKVEPIAKLLPPLPPIGMLLEKNALYVYEGKVVLVQETHARVG